MKISKFLTLSIMAGLLIGFEAQARVVDTNKQGVMTEAPPANQSVQLRQNPYSYPPVEARFEYDRMAHESLTPLENFNFYATTITNMLKNPAFQYPTGNTKDSQMDLNNAYQSLKNSKPSTAVLKTAKTEYASLMKQLKAVKASAKPQRTPGHKPVPKHAGGFANNDQVVYGKAPVGQATPPSLA